MVWKNRYPLAQHYSFSHQRTDSTQSPATNQSSESRSRLHWEEKAFPRVAHCAAIVSNTKKTISFTYSLMWEEKGELENVRKSPPANRMAFCKFCENVVAF